MLILLQNSDVIGLFVLERCLVELDGDDEHPYSFILSEYD